ncbi:MAG: PEP-CTERM sorting domain-containing protein [Terrimicrobiaceae bacterium]|jgi:hypothetical protein
MTTKKFILCGTVGTLLGIALCPAAKAATVVYEGFGYTAGTDLGGQNGGTGFNGAWIDSAASGNKDKVQSGSLAYGSLQTAGNALLLVTPFTGLGLDRSFSTISGVDGTTTWISFLLKFDGSSGTLNAGDVGWLSVRPSDFGSSPQFGAFTNESDEVVFAIGDYGGGDPVFSATPFEADTTYLLVGSITWHTDPGQAEDISLFLNPTFGPAPGTPLVSRNDLDLVNDPGDNLLVKMSILADGGDSAWLVDEIRIGASFGDVTPVPEPSAVLLALAGGALLWSRRRRK